MVNMPSCGHNQSIGSIVALIVVPHGVAWHIHHGLGGAAYRPTQLSVLAENRFNEGFMGQVARVIGGFR